MPPKLLFPSYSNALTIATLSWLVSLSPWSANLSPKQCSPSCSQCTSKCPHHCNTQTSSLLACQSPNFLSDCTTVSSPSSPPLLLISQTFYICTLLLNLFAPVLTPASSKFCSISARQKVVMLSLTLVLLSGTPLK